MSEDVNENDSHLSLVAQNPPEILKTPTTRARGKPFLKGNVMNPGGRPKLTEEQKQIKFNLVEACRLLAPEALKVLEDLMRNAKQDSVRLNAATALVERGFGKAVQPTDNVNRHAPIDESMTAEESYKLMLSAGRKAA